MMKRKLIYFIGWLGVKLCNFAYYRPCTDGEIASTLQYVRGMIAYMELHGHESARVWQMHQYKEIWEARAKEVKPGSSVN